MKSLLWIIALPLMMAGDPGMDLGVERMYIGFQAVPNSSTVCKLVLQVKVSNHGDIESPVCDLHFFAAPVRSEKSFPCTEDVEISALAPGESLDLKKEWRVDKIQADQMCKEMCCGIMLVKAELIPRDTIRDTNFRNDEIVSVLLGKLPENHTEITSLDSAFVKMTPEDKTAILAEIKDYESLILRMVKAGNSGCWVNHENGYASLVHLNR